MRISDWSSDVCSSDFIALISWRRASVIGSTTPPILAYAQIDSISSTAPLQTSRCTPPPSATTTDMRSEERRVGKGVSVRVELGGRRIITKKKDQQIQKNKADNNKSRKVYNCRP